MQFKELLQKWYKHIYAILLFTILSVTYFAPAVFQGKSIRQGDMDKFAGMVGGKQMEQYEATAQPGEFSVWSDAMFGGMPYTSGYGHAAPQLPSFKILETPIVSWGAFHASIVLLSMICFYIFLYSIGVKNTWVAIGGSIAFAFASYNLIIIEAGHITKAYAIAYMPLTLAGMALLFKKKFYWGGILFLSGVAFSIAASHIQITYYLMLFCFFIYLGYCLTILKEKKYADWSKTTLIIIGSIALAILPNLKNMYTNWDLGKHSTRGETELTPKPDQFGKVEKKSSGLDKDYAFAWSYGKSELLTLLVPNAYGGASNGTVGEQSALHQVLRAKGHSVGKEIPTITYWGDKTFTSGPVYFGAVVCFLFVLGMFVIKNKIKWWIFAGTVFLTFLAFGRNLAFFNDFMFHYLPLYNKFRTVEMALVIPGMTFPIIGFWGLSLILSGKCDMKILNKGIKAALIVTGGLALIVWLIPGLLLNFQSPIDNYYQLEDWYYNALISDRRDLASADGLRSLVFILFTAALLIWYFNSKEKNKSAKYVGMGIAFLVLIDLWNIDRRYLNNEDFVEATHTVDLYKLSIADKEILKDKTSYRVINLNDPFQDTSASYYHHSVGGYHAAKLRRYQELIEHRLQPEVQSIINRFDNAKTVEDILPALNKCPSLNMLNTRYIIFSPQQPPIVNPYAYGNCWFVNNFKMVKNADEEIAALNETNPLETAIIDERFANIVGNFKTSADSSASIALTNYRPNILTYKSKSKTEQLAVFSEVYYQPGWKAYVDGKEIPHFRTDWILRGLIVPAGEHEIVFEFRPQGYIVAANIEAYSSFIILLLLVSAIVFSLWKTLKGNPKNVEIKQTNK